MKYKTIMLTTVLIQTIMEKIVKCTKQTVEQKRLKKEKDEIEKGLKEGSLFEFCGQYYKVVDGH